MNANGLMFDRGEAPVGQAGFPPSRPSSVPAYFATFSDAQEFLAQNAGGEPFAYPRDSADTLRVAESLGVREAVEKAIALSRELDPVIDASVRRAERAAKALDKREHVDGDGGGGGDGGDGGGDEKLSQSEILVRLALDLYEIHRSDLDEPFAIRKNGPNIALMFRGSKDALRSTIAREFRKGFRKTPNASAIANALVALQGEALECEPQSVHLRVASHDDGIVIDLGRQDGQVVVVRPGRWKVSARSPVTFRRTALTAELPIPECGGDVNMLRCVLNVSDDTWLLLLGWITATFVPDIPHPVLLLGGEQGSAKTTTTRTVVSISDPSPAPVRSQPNDPESWVMAAAGSWVVAVDNVSTITPWWSDSLCKAVTGDGMIRRKLYTDSELAVIALRRCIILTSIDAGALRGDLGDRVLLADLEPIPASRRRSEADLDAVLHRDRPRIFGALLDILAGVLAELPKVELRELPRMADFARVLAAMDKHLETDALARYLGQRGRVVQEVLDGDPIAGAIQAIGSWEGTSADLYKRLTPDGTRPPHGWPKTPRGLTARLKGLAPALRQVGAHIVFLGVRSNRGRVLRIERSNDGAIEPSQPSQQSPSEGNRSDGRPEDRDGRDGLVMDDHLAFQSGSDCCDGCDGHSPIPTALDRELL